MGLIARWVRAPLAAGASQVAGHSEFLVHELRVKFRGPFRVKIQRDGGQVVIDAIPVSQDMDVAPALKGIGHSQNRAMNPHGDIYLRQVFTEIIPGAVNPAIPPGIDIFGDPIT